MSLLSTASTVWACVCACMVYGDYTTAVLFDSRVQSPLFLYTFSWQECQCGKISDTSGSRVLGDLVLGTDTLCTLSNGVHVQRTSRSPAIYSEYNSTKLVQSMEKSIAYTVEMWMQLNRSEWTQVSTSLARTVYAFTAAQGYNCTQGYLQRDASPAFTSAYRLVSSCNTVSANVYTTVFDTPMQIAFTFSPGTLWSRGFRQYVTKLYANGQLLTTVTNYDTQGLLDFRDPYELLTLMGTHNYGIPGAIYLFAMQVHPPCEPSHGVAQHVLVALRYNFTLSAAEVLQNYEAELPSNAPAALNTTSTVLEDGEMQGSNVTQDTFRCPFPPTTLAIVSCPYFDADEVVGSLTHQAYGLQKATCTLLRLPEESDAELFTLDGSLISSSNFTIPRQDNSSFRVRPAFNRFNYTFHVVFHITDGFTGRKSNTATAAFVVKAVNDPPIAISSQFTATSRVATCLALNATDIDNSRSELVFTIEYGPTEGALYNCDSTLQVSSSRTSGAATLPFGYVGYQYLGVESGGLSGVIANDSFAFSVSDGEYSSVAFAVISVYTRLEAVPSFDNATGKTSATANDYTVNEHGVDGGDLDDSVRIMAYDLAANSSGLEVVLVSLPVALAGTLLFDNQSLVRASAPVRMQRVTDGLFEYYFTFIGASGFFTSPDAAYYGGTIPTKDVPSFSFFVQSESLQSTVQSQSILVRLVNSPPELTNNQAAFVVGGSSSISPTLLYLSGFGLSDVDYDTDPVRVHVDTSDGYVRLSPEANVSLVSCSNTLCPCTASSGWQCIADTKYHHSLDFVVLPSRGAALLNALEFYSNDASTIVPLTVYVYDGAGDSCIDWSALGDTRVTRTACYGRNITLEVNVGDIQYVNASQASSYSSASLWYIQYLELGAVCAALMGLGNWVRVRCCRKRSATDAGQVENTYPLGTPPCPDPPTHASEAVEARLSLGWINAYPDTVIACDSEHSIDPRTDSQSIGTCWRYAVDEHGDVYYYNLVTSEISWTFPAEAQECSSTDIHAITD